MSGRASLPRTCVITAVGVLLAIAASAEIDVVKIELKKLKFRKLGQ